MAYFNKFKGIKGFKTMYDRVIRFRYMITAIAQERTRILAFWEKHGTEATKEAFNTSRATLFRWQKALANKHGQLEALNPTSTAPKHKRKRIISDIIKQFILKERKQEKLGKEKLSVLLREDKIANLSASTVGRILADMKKRGELLEPRRLSLSAKTGRLIERKPKRYKKKLRSKNHAGGLVKADSIVRFTNGIKRYVLTALDIETKFAFAYAYKNHSSSGATDFMEKFKSVAPISLTHVQTDNGSEFAYHFDIFLEKNSIVHFHTYPRCPKQNAEIERFNRTISEAFIQPNRLLLAHDIDSFNKKLMEWLLWYNTRRPHWSIGLVSPLRYIVSRLPEQESQMWWTSTNTVMVQHLGITFSSK